MLHDKIEPHPLPCRRLGDGKLHHFFGYYNKSTWDRTDRYVLAQRVPMADADLHPGLIAEIGFFDTQDDDRFQKVGQTTAWNWQMGAQLQWLDGAPGRQLIYNCRTDDESAFYPCLGAVIHDVASGVSRPLPMPVYVVAPDSRYALCVDYRRLYVTHQTIGYSDEASLRALPQLDLAPARDGIHVMDLATGMSRLIVSYDTLRNFHPVPSMDKAIHWVSHIEINPSSSRVLFLHRWTERVEDETCFLHRLITVNPDGTDMRLLECSDHPLPQLAAHFDPNAVGTFDYEKSEYQISHPLWKDDTHIIVWGPHAGSIHYHLYEDRADGEVTVIGADVLTENGHMTFSRTHPDWLLSDTYPDAQTNERILFLYHVPSGVRHDIGSFYTSPTLKKENRCDLHPRWSRDGKRVCIDSIHDGNRQMYALDVAALVDPA
ncbi:hypothetical protein D769_17619 [Cupriavidus sp. HMR-1]|uniref:hypothetical protein n=1 Tax=Cupriavidus sp. HMR-1 TaxID=1249621 RepID=UPI0002A3891C|nr:hypothetical protein [Cupriavidus sp. HMR-1]EKZ97953.1 hypothetical protein D769_17619 [Cupriavidus sp. HMR-1]